MMHFWITCAGISTTIAGLAIAEFVHFAIPAPGFPPKRIEGIVSVVCRIEQDSLLAWTSAVKFSKLLIDLYTTKVLPLTASAAIA